MSDEDLAASIARIGAASAEVEESHGKARPAAVAAVRALESALVVALGESPLRGLPNLAFGTERCMGMRVRSRGRHLQVTEGESTLIVWKDGSLRIAEGMNGTVRARIAHDADLMVEDLEDVLRCFAEVIARELTSRHVDYAERSTDRYVRIHELASRVFQLLR